MAAPSERIQRQVERLLDEAADAISRNDWATVRQRADAALAFDPGNADALAYRVAAERADGAATADRDRESVRVEAPEARTVPASFVNGRYEVVRLLGEGATKRVHLAHDAKLDRDVAFALIKTDGLDADGLTRIRREAQAMARLGDHPNIVAVHDIGDEAGQPYIVSQFMAGGDLRQLIEQAAERRLPLDQALQIAGDVAAALEHAMGTA